MKTKCDVCGAGTIVVVADNHIIQTGVTFEYHGCDTKFFGVDNPTLCHKCIKLVVKQMVPKAKEHNVDDESSETACDLDAKINSVDTRTRDLNDDVLNVEKRLVEVFSHIQDLNDQHTASRNELDSNFKMLNDMVVGLSRTMDQLSKKVDAQANDVNIDVHGNNQRISALEERMSLVDGSLTDLVSETCSSDNALLKRVEDLEHRMSGTNNRVEALESATSNASNARKSMRRLVTETSTYIKRLHDTSFRHDKDIGSLTVRVNELEGVDVSGMNQTLTETVRRCDDFAKYISGSLKETINTLLGNCRVIGSRIDTLTEIVDESLAGDRALVERVEHLEGEAISAESSKSLLDRIRDLENRTMNIDASLYDLPAKYGLTKDDIDKVKAGLGVLGLEVRSIMKHLKNAHNYEGSSATYKV